MPSFAPDAPRIPLIVNGVSITAPAPYTTGHALTEPEAAFMNRMVAGAVGNPYATSLAKLAKEGKTTEIPTGDALQAAFDKRYEDYTVSVRGTGEASTPSTPLERMIKSLATEKLTALVLAKGLKPSDLRKAATKIVNGVETDSTAWDRNLAALMTRDKDKFTAQAQSILDSITSDDDIEVEQEPVAAE